MQLSNPFTVPDLVPLPAPPRILTYRTRAAGKSEFTRRAALAGRLKNAAARATDSAMRDIWLKKASQCAYLPTAALRGPAPAAVDIAITEARARPINLKPWIGGLFMLSIAIALTGCSLSEGVSATDNGVTVAVFKDGPCQYLVARNSVEGGASITPRLGPDGKPMCGGVK